MTFEKTYRDAEIILTEGPFVERLKSEFIIEMDKRLNHVGLIYSNPEPLETLYRQYIDVGQKFDLPVMIMTPTRKVNKESVKFTSFRDKNLLMDSCNFLHRIKESYGSYSEKIFIGALLGCKGDAYEGKKVFGKNDAYMFHRQQTSLFDKRKVDFLFAGIMPEINEAKGMAKAMVATGIPYIISFMIRKDGRLLDGTLLSKAIEMIDKEVDPIPVCYMVNCIHPTNLIQALKHEQNKNSPYLHRLNGIQSNASLLSPEKLNNCDTIHRDDFDIIIDEMCFLKDHFDFKILGGCCGTDEKFIHSLADKITRNNYSAIQMKGKQIKI